MSTQTENKQQQKKLKHTQNELILMTLPNVMTIFTVLVILEIISTIFNEFLMVVSRTENCIHNKLCPLDKTKQTKKSYEI